LTLGNNTNVAGMSADGNVVVGYVEPATETNASAFRWTLGTGIKTLPNLSGADECTALAVSADGAYAVGWCSSTSSVPVRWSLPPATTTSGTTTPTPINLGVPDGFETAQALAVNSDGSVITGNAYNAGGGAAAIWTIGEKPEVISNATAVTSSAGKGIVGTGNNVVIVGQYAITSSSILGAFKWTAGSGMVLLPFLPGAPATGSQAGAYALSNDNTQIVGFSQNSSNSLSAVLWTANAKSGITVTDLAANTGFDAVSAYAISGDGKTIVGGDGAGAWIWNDGAIQPIASILAPYNVDLSPYILNSANCISSNGKIVAGNAVLSSNADINVGWIANLQ
jgi:uncharacterized membrane protein